MQPVNTFYVLCEMCCLYISWKNLRRQLLHLLFMRCVTRPRYFLQLSDVLKSAYVLTFRALAPPPTFISWIWRSVCLSASRMDDFNASSPALCALIFFYCHSAVQWRRPTMLRFCFALFQLCFSFFCFLI